MLRGGMVIQWLALPHSKNVPGSNLVTDWGLCLWSLFSLCLYFSAKDIQVSFVGVFT